LDLDELRREGQRIFDKLRAAYAERDYRRGTESDLFPPVFPVASPLPGRVEPSCAR
jgi:hypothetical protein